MGRRRKVFRGAPRTLGQYIGQNMGDRTIGQLSIEVGITSRYMGEVLEDKKGCSDEVLAQICYVLKLNKFFVFYLVRKWPEEYLGLTLEEFQRQYGAGSIESAVAS
jgi:hypothetical protein